jgi:hypothetical protein
VKGQPSKDFLSVDEIKAVILEVRSSLGFKPRKPHCNSVYTFRRFIKAGVWDWPQLLSEPFSRSVYVPPMPRRRDAWLAGKSFLLPREPLTELDGAVPQTAEFGRKRLLPPRQSEQCALFQWKGSSIRKEPWLALWVQLMYIR